MPDPGVSDRDDEAGDDHAPSPSDRDHDRHPSGGEPADPRPGWQADPTGHYEFRWWDGGSWTNRVAGEGVAAHEHRFAALPPARKGWRGADIAAYADPVRFARAFGEVTMPTAGLRRWEVLGEGRYQAALDELAGPKQYDGVWVEKQAALVPSDRGHGEDRPVTVTIEGLLVGHLEHAAGTAHRRLIEQAVQRAGSATCGAVINGGWYREDEASEGSYGVHLYFGYGPGVGPDRLPHPVADEERIPYRISERHDHITVTGEERTQAALHDVLAEDWAGDHPFRLASLALGPDPRGRETVTVMIDGQVVGWLTPRMTERFRPVLETAAAAGRRVTAAATLEPSGRAGHEHEIDVVLRVPRGFGRASPDPSAE